MVVVCRWFMSPACVFVSGVSNFVLIDFMRHSNIYGFPKKEFEGCCPVFSTEVFTVFCLLFRSGTRHVTQSKSEASLHPRRCKTNEIYVVLLSFVYYSFITVGLLSCAQQIPAGQYMYPFPYPYNWNVFSGNICGRVLNGELYAQSTVFVPAVEDKSSWNSL